MPWLQHLWFLVMAGIKDGWQHDSWSRMATKDPSTQFRISSCTMFGLDKSNPGWGGGDGWALFWSWVGRGVADIPVLRPDWSNTPFPWPEPKHALCSSPHQDQNRVRPSPDTTRHGPDIVRAGMPLAFSRRWAFLFQYKFLRVTKVKFSPRYFLLCFSFSLFPGKENVVKYHWLK